MRRRRIVVIAGEGWRLGINGGGSACIDGEGFACEGVGLAFDLNPVSIITRDGWDD